MAIEYEELQPVITNIEAGIRHNSFFDFDHTVQQGPDVEAALRTPGAVVVEGEMKIGGQEHFYLEPNATLAIPGEVRTARTNYAVLPRVPFCLPACLRIHVVVW